MTSWFLLGWKAMLGIVYLIVALACWTVWAVLSAQLGCKFSPLNSLLWTGLVYAAITVGGFVVHHRQLRLPDGNEWWLLGIFCVASTVASLGYYAALRHLPSTVVLPLSHLYLVFGPVLIALLERRSMSLGQVGALTVTMVGVLWFLAASPSEGKKEPVAQERNHQSAPVQSAEMNLERVRMDL